MKKRKVVLTVLLLSILLSGCSSKISKDKVTKSSSSTSQSSIIKESTSQEIDQVKEKTSETQEFNQFEDANQAEESSVVQENNNDGWKKEFENKLYENFQVTVKEYVDYGNGYFGVFVNEVDTGDNAYVTVNSATGNFHG
ncbi:hypothetical protein GIX45_25975 [Erwinia sp. CPCC 100877]|nr:hypothetical protein [Erwinia sp. CPCC 100877]